MKKTPVLIVILFTIFTFSFGTNLSSFSSDRLLLKYDYSKDTESVYYKNKRIKNSDPDTFLILDYRYAKDSNQAYYLSHSGDPNIYKGKLLGELQGICKGVRSPFNLLSR